MCYDVTNYERSLNWYIYPDYNVGYLMVRSSQPGGVPVTVSPLLTPPLLRLGSVGVLSSVPVALVIKRAGYTHTRSRVPRAASQCASNRDQTNRVLTPVVYHGARSPPEGAADTAASQCTSNRIKPSAHSGCLSWCSLPPRGSCRHTHKVYTIRGVPCSRPGACPVVYHGARSPPEGAADTHRSPASLSPVRLSQKISYFVP